MNVLILSSSEGIAIGLLRCLRLADANGFVFSIWASSQASRLSRYCSGYRSSPIAEAPRDLAGLARKIDEYCRENKVELVMPAGILGTFILAKIKHDLRCAAVFPTPSPEQLHALNNKWLFHQLLVRHEIPAPETVLIESSAQLASLPLHFPLILKPLALGNGEGVQRVDSTQEIERYMARGDKSGRLPLLAQEFVPGSDVIFGILAKDGELLAWTMHERTADWLHFFPNPALLELGRKIIRACNYSGAANFDVRLDAATGRMAFIECNPRLWNSAPISVYYGVDIIRLGICAALGQAPPADFKTGVDRVEDVPYPTPRRYLRGLLTGDYPLRHFKRDLAWLSLIDPLPTLKDMLWDRLHLINLYDSAVIEEMSRRDEP